MGADPNIHAATDMAALDQVSEAVESGAGLPAVARAAGRAIGASVIAGPPVTATFFKEVMLSTNPIHWPSGETNGELGAPVNTATGARTSSARTNSCVPWLPT